MVLFPVRPTDSNIHKGDEEERRLGAVITMMHLALVAHSFSHIYILCGVWQALACCSGNRADDNIFVHIEEGREFDRVAAARPVKLVESKGSVE